MVKSHCRSFRRGVTLRRPGRRMLRRKRKGCWQEKENAFLYLAAFSICLRMLVALLQGLTLVHFSAQLERFLRDRGCA